MTTNYRSEVVFGVASFVEDVNEKVEALKVFTEHIVPGRWVDTRQPTRQEIAGTLVLSLPLTEVSAKICTGAVMMKPTMHCYSGRENCPCAWLPLSLWRILIWRME